MSDEIRNVAITRLGARGDGVAETDSGPLYAPFTLPGEEARVRRDTSERATLVEVTRSSPDRVAPVCRHFGQCGGCQLQHFAVEPTLAWKREQVRAAFAARGVDAPVAPVIAFPDARRRRAVLTARREDGGVALGFHAAREHTVVPVSECPVLAPEIERALPGLRRLVTPLTPHKGEIKLTVLLTEVGLDVTIDGATEMRNPTALEAASAEAARLGAARLTINGGLAFLGKPPAVRFGAATVLPPPGAFLQALAEAEQAMANLARDAIGKARRVADLFSGLGAFTFPFAQEAEVMAVDSDPAAIAALQAAARRTPGLRPITAKVRDLFRAPLAPKELAPFDAVVFDPPRAGAKAQAEAIARSTVPVVVAVSCDMATLARDARALIDGGYALEAVTPLDQFRYTPHVEAVAAFRRRAEPSRASSTMR